MQFIYGQNEISIVDGASNPSNAIFYDPSPLKTSVGSTVFWTNDDYTIHTVTSGSPDVFDVAPAFDSGIMAAGKTFAHTFVDAGTFDYYCTLHPFMTGKIIVIDNKASSTFNNTQPIQQKNSESIDSSNLITEKLGIIMEATEDAVGIIENTSNPVEFKDEIKFSNYTNLKGGIQFEYPSDWEIIEKASRFESGPDLMFADFSSNRNFNVMFPIPESKKLSDNFGIEKMTEITLESIINTFGKEYKIIENPSTIFIDGKETRTFLITEQDKYEDFAIKYAKQYWLANSNDGLYGFTFISSTTTFDKPENIQIRDHFINSIKFIETDESKEQTDLNKIVPEKKSRFD